MQRGGVAEVQPAPLLVNVPLSFAPFKYTSMAVPGPSITEANPYQVLVDNAVAPVLLVLALSTLLRYVPEISAAETTVVHLGVSVPALQALTGKLAPEG